MGFITLFVSVPGVTEGFCCAATRWIHYGSVAFARGHLILPLVPRAAFMHAGVGGARHGFLHSLSTRSWPGRLRLCKIGQGSIDATVVGCALRKGLQVYIGLLLGIKPPLVTLVTGGSTGQRVTAGVTGILGLSLQNSNKVTDISPTSPIHRNIDHLSEYVPLSAGEENSCRPAPVC